MSTRDIGLDHSAGKGDLPRHKADDNYRYNYDSIDWKREFARDGEILTGKERLTEFILRGPRHFRESNSENPS